MPNIYDRGKGGSPGALSSSGGGMSQGARRVNRPLTSSEKKQNKSAETYKTNSTLISEKQARARAAQSERMKKAASKARTYNKAVATAAGSAGAVGFVAGSEVENRSSKYVPNDSARRDMAMNRAKTKIKQARAKSNAGTSSSTTVNGKAKAATTGGKTAATGVKKKVGVTRVPPSKRQEGASRNRAAEGPKKSTAKSTRSR